MPDQTFPEPEFVTAQRAEQIQPDLPPAGYKRDEELARRTDILEEKAEKQFADRGAIPESAFEPEREIQYDIRRGFMDIRLKQAQIYKVKWVNFRAQQGNQVWAAKAEGWRIVTPEMVEELDRDLVREDNTLRVGDVVAMYMRLDYFVQLEQERERRRLKALYGVNDAELEELAKKNPKVFKILHAGEETTTEAGQRAFNQIEKQAVRKTAQRMLGERMKRGTIPGVPIT